MAEAKGFHTHGEGQICGICYVLARHAAEIKNLQRISSTCKDKPSLARFQTNDFLVSKIPDIEVKRQQGSFDCGQTCLEMLGYQGREMVKDRPVDTLDIGRIDGVKWGEEEYSESSATQMILLQLKSGSNHWVVGNKDVIVCPARGVYGAKEYKENYVERILYRFEVPLLYQIKT